MEEQRRRMRRRHPRPVRDGRGPRASTPPCPVGVSCILAHGGSSVAARGGRERGRTAIVTGGRDGDRPGDRAGSRGPARGWRCAAGGRMRSRRRAELETAGRDVLAMPCDVREPGAGGVVPRRGGRTLRSGRRPGQQRWRAVRRAARAIGLKAARSARLQRRRAVAPDEPHRGAMDDPEPRRLRLLPRLQPPARRAADGALVRRQGGAREHGVAIASSGRSSDRAVCMAAGLIRTEGCSPTAARSWSTSTRRPCRCRGRGSRTRSPRRSRSSRATAVRHRHHGRRRRRRGRVGVSVPAPGARVSRRAGLDTREEGDVADALQNYIDGRWVDAQDGARFDVFNPATGEVIATAPDSKQADVDAAVAAARRTFDDGTWWPGTPAREQADPPHGGGDRASGAGAARGDGIRRLRQDDGDAREDIAELPTCSSTTGLGHEDRRGLAPRLGRRDVHGLEGAGRRRRRHHAVELPVDDGRAEGRAGDRDGLHVRPETPEQTPQTCLELGRSWRRRAADRRVARPHGLRRDRGRAARRASRRRQGRLHGVEGGREADHAQRRRHAEAGDARAGRQVAEHRVLRRAPAHGVRGVGERRVLEPGGRSVRPGPGSSSTRRSTTTR